jgi:uncharacterized protein (DUF2236 family)
MVDFDERDLLTWTEAAGFAQLRIDYHVEVTHRAPPAPNLDAFLDIAPNPLAPSYREMLHHALGESERTRLIAAIREQFRLGRWHYRSATVHLAATTG